MTQSIADKMKVVIIADSLALARGEGWGDIKYEETYPCLLDIGLRSKFKEIDTIVIERGMRFRTILNVLEDWDELVKLRKADFVIVHVGIVDCAPRVFSARERAILERYFPTSLRNKIINFVSKNRKRIINWRSERVYVPQTVFAEKLKVLVLKAKESGIKKLFVVNIVEPPDFIENRSPGYRNNVIKYNRMINNIIENDFIEQIDINGLLKLNGGIEKFTYDGMHINANGHRILANELLSSIA